MQNRIFFGVSGNIGVTVNEDTYHRLGNIENLTLEDVLNLEDAEVVQYVEGTWEKENNVHIPLKIYHQM